MAVTVVVTKYTWKGSEQKESLSRLTGGNAALGHTSLLLSACVIRFWLVCSQGLNLLCKSVMPSARMPAGRLAVNVSSALLYWHRIPPASACLIKCFPSQASCLLYREWEAAWVHSVVLWHGCDTKLRTLASFQLRNLHFAFLNCLAPTTCCCHSLKKKKPPDLGVGEQLLGSCWEVAVLQWKTHSGEWIVLQLCSFSLVHSPFPVFQMLPLSMLPRPSLIVYEQR